MPNKEKVKEAVEDYGKCEMLNGIHQKTLVSLAQSYLDNKIGELASDEEIYQIILNNFEPPTYWTDSLGYKLASALSHKISKKLSVEEIANILLCFNVKYTREHNGHFPSVDEQAKELFKEISPSP